MKTYTKLYFWLLYLAEQGVLDSYIENLKNNTNPHFGACDMSDINDLGDVVGRGFYWSYSPQGFFYWAAHANKAIALFGKRGMS